MPNVRNLQRSFAGGEVSPEMFGRIDDAKYQSGLKTCRNFIVKPQGPAENRPGFAFVREVKDSNKRTRLLPFTYSTTQTMVLEVGEGYIRFHTQGATLLYSAPAAYNNATAYVPGDMVSSGGANYYCAVATTGNAPPNASYWSLLPSNPNIYEVSTPYLEADLFDIHYVQSADVLTLVHPNYPVAELRRNGATNWTLTAVPFGPTISAPGAPTVVAAVAAGTGITTVYTYVVTAVASDLVSESVASGSASVTNNLLNSGNYNTISWSAVTGASLYNVYKLQGGLYGYIGQTSGTSITDDNITPDLGKTPPNYEAVFDGSGKYPGAVSYFEQRRCFAGSTNEPQTIRMTKSGTESNMSYSLPIKDDDRISFRVAAREANTIRHIVPLSQLLLLTSAAEWRVTSVNSDAITPSSISVKPQSYVGASNVQPVIVNNTLIYGASRGGHVRECAYNWQANGFITGDLSLRAPHLFDNFDVTDMTYAKAPQPIVWATSSSGDLLGLTYVPEQQVGAWHRHDTGAEGSFESVAAVAEGSEDRLYAVIQREIDGNTVRYIERMASRQFSAQEDAFFVDCGGTYDGAPTTSVTGLTWLEGETVSILADGAVHPQRTVTGGAITLENEASVVHVGLPIEADLETLPLAMQIDNGFGQGRFKNVNRAWLRVYRSSGIFVGPDEDGLTEAKQRTTEDYGTPPALVSDEIEVVLDPAWGSSGQVLVRQSDPLPLTVVALTLEVALGG